jgi:hypothetical protein
VVLRATSRFKRQFTGNLEGIPPLSAHIRVGHASNAVHIPIKKERNGHSVHKKNVDVLTLYGTSPQYSSFP